MAWALAFGTLVVMAVLAVRANARFADNRYLPIQFGPTGQVGWTAPRIVALGFLPGLAVLVFLGLLLFAPDPLGAIVSSMALLGGQVFYHWMIGRTV